MKKNSLTTAVVAGIAGVAGFAGLANAVHLNPDGLGQVLLYPYYTVNEGQQTVLSVVNTSTVAKAVKVRFLEGYNTREVLDFNLFLSPYDVWTATIFALADDGKPSDGAAILTTDRSCTAPLFSEGDGQTSNGRNYVEFRDFAYMNPDDGGPYTIDRTREGHFEIIGMADLTGSLATAVKHNASGVPANCGAVRNLTGAEADLQTAPTSGLFGGAGIVDVAEGTFYTYNADALERFTSRAIFTANENILPNLADVNDGTGPLADQATANIFTGTGVTSSVYPGTNPLSRRVDAVSAIFTADAVYNEFQVAANLGANSDWVVTFPTKSFYVDELYIGAGSAARQPFVNVYDGSDGYSCVQVALNIYDQEERTPTSNTGFSPPRPGGRNEICREVNVISFIETTATVATSEVLGSKLVSNVRPNYGAGWLKLGLAGVGSETHALYAAQNGNVWRGLPVSGFYATSIVNNNATVIGGVSVLSNYSGVFKHRTSRNCINSGNACS